MKNSRTVINIGGGFWTWLLLAFIILKVAGVGAIATWSWWWVLSPLWIPVAAVVIIFAVLVIAWCILSLIR